MAVVELIADGVHLDPHTVSMVFALVGAANIALVTDSMAATGLPDGDYQLGACEVTVANGEARLRSNEAIRGGTSTPLDQVRNVVNWGAPSSIRVILAHLPTAEVKELIKSRKIIVLEGSDVDDLLVDLRAISEEGFAVNDGATTPEEFGVSAPIFDTQGKIIGCIVVSAPRTRVEHRSFRTLLIKSVQDAATGVTKRLGKSSDQ